MIGRTVGTYKIEQKIGEGGMGAVYKGVDLMLERTVAVKVLRPELARQPRVLERFRSEAVTLARLNHPNIATLYSFLQDGDEFFMILEFVQGQTFEDLLRRGAMSWEEALPLFCQALDGIAHAHTHGIIHRDVKPANVMLTDTGGVKVMDFGIARVLGTARMTRTGHLIGTIEYMSPEQVRGQETDARSDIYSLGILLYEMLTGRVPFEADSDFGLMQAHVSQTPRSLRAFSPSVPAAVERAVLRALAKKPRARFPDVVAFREALDQALGAVAAPVGERPASGRGLAWLRHLFTPASAASSAPPEAAQPTDAAPAPAAPPAPTAEAAPVAPPPPVAAAAPAAEAARETRLAAAQETRLAAAQETRLAGAQETRLAPEATVGDNAPGPGIAALRRRPLWWYAAAAAPLLLAVLAFALLQPRWFNDGPVRPDADTLAVVNADTTADVVGERTPAFQGPLPDRPVERDQPSLLSPEEFARLNPPQDQPTGVPETAPDTPSEQTPSEQTPSEQTPPEETTPARREPERVVEESKRAAEETATTRLGNVRIIVRPFGDIFVDGSRKARDTNQPYSETLSAGTYVVRAVHPRFGAWEKRVSVKAGETREVLFNFNAEYQVTVTSQPPNAEIILDGRRTRRYTPSVLTVRPGQHTVSVRKSGYAREQAQSLMVERTLSDPVHFILQQN